MGNLVGSDSSTWLAARLSAESTSRNSATPSRNRARGFVGSLPNACSSRSTACCGGATCSSKCPARETSSLLSMLASCSARAVSRACWNAAAGLGKAGLSQDRRTHAATNSAYSALIFRWLAWTLGSAAHEWSARWKAKRAASKSPVTVQKNSASKPIASFEPASAAERRLPTTTSLSDPVHALSDKCRLPHHRNEATSN
mmetsp:Transcript_9092/g.21764  ORF Transcript_9092/g.21764 Transcript_9092/m.21764 type:complete len:200 (-) Transcript_9092:642-1241(-)